MGDVVVVVWDGQGERPAWHGKVGVLFSTHVLAGLPLQTAKPWLVFRPDVDPGLPGMRAHGGVFRVASAVRRPTEAELVTWALGDGHG